MIKFKGSFIVIFLCMLFAVMPSFVSKVVFADTADGSELNPYTISSNVEFDKYVKLINSNADYADKSYKLLSDLTLTQTETIGTQTIPFKGTFDGCGFSIYNVEFNSTLSGNVDNFLGLFGYVNGGTIKNLRVETLISIKDGGFGNKTCFIGGLVGKMENNSVISACQVSTSFFNKSFEEEVEKISTIDFSGSVVFGGIVGEISASTIENSFVQLETNFIQKGENAVESFFGGIVGKIDCGTIRNSYVAPSNEVIQSLTGSIAEVTNIKIQNQNTNPASLLFFGGIAGYVTGASNVEIINTLFVGYLKNNNHNKLVCGGIVGKISKSNTPISSQIRSSKFLGVTSISGIVSINSAIGSKPASYITQSSLTQITEIPANESFFKTGWDPIVFWNFDEIWKNSTLFSGSGVFFPSLQQFSELSYYLDYQNYNTFYTLNFVGEDETIKTKKFKLGELVSIELNFISQMENFYEIDSWIKVGNDTTKLGAQKVLSFVCTNDNAGSYYVSLKGKPVQINVSIKTEEKTDIKNFGAVKFQTTVNNSSFNFQATYADSSFVSVLEAVESIEEFKFARWETESGNFVSTDKQISFKLDNTRGNLVPDVVSNSEGKLVCNLTAYFSNNTSDLTINIPSNGGTISIDGTDAIDKSGSQNVVNGRKISLVATVKDGYAFEGWFKDGTLISDQKSITTSIVSSTTLEARFRELDPSEKGGVNIWIIIGSVGGGLALIGIIALIIVIIKRRGNSFRNFKKNYRY